MQGLESALFYLGIQVKNCTQIFLKENILLNFLENFGAKEFARFTQVSSVKSGFSARLFNILRVLQ